MIHLSRYKAAVMYHLAKYPDELDEMLEMPAQDQIEAFHQLEGELKERYYKGKKVAVPEPKASEPTAAERDAKKPKPSEAVSVKGGSQAANGIPALFLPDGHTINPAWKAYRNSVQGVRP